MPVLKRSTCPVASPKVAIRVEKQTNIRVRTTRERARGRAGERARVETLRERENACAVLLTVRGTDVYKMCQEVASHWRCFTIY